MINVQGADKYEILQKLGVTEPKAAIYIKWKGYDPYLNVKYCGCIVDATIVGGEFVPKEFKTAVEATRYIGAILRKHDKYVKDENKKREDADKKAKKVKK